MATFFPAQNSAMLILLGGKSESKAMEGILVPGVMAAKASAPPMEAKVMAKRLKNFIVL